jgi:hypothetical protein
MNTDSIHPILAMKPRNLCLQEKTVRNEITTKETEAAVALLGLSGLILPPKHIIFILSDQEREAQIQSLTKQILTNFRQCQEKCKRRVKNGRKILDEYSNNHFKLKEELALARIGFVTQKMHANNIRQPGIIYF